MSANLSQANINMSTLGLTKYLNAFNDSTIKEKVEAKQQPLETLSTKNFFNEAQVQKFEAIKADGFLNKRFIAHLFGDSFIRNSTHEGWFVTDAILHMIHTLRENAISPEVVAVLEDLETCLAWHEKLVALNLIDDDDDDIEDIESNNGASSENEVQDVDETIDYKAEIKKKLASEVVKGLQNLNAGQKLVITGGCMGHSVLYEFFKESRQTYTFSVYNTGNGVEKHNVIIEGEGNEKVYGVYRILDVAKQKVEDPSFLEAIFDIRINATVSDFAERLYDQLLPTLEGTVKKPSTDLSDYMLVQRSGTCSWKMFSAFLRYNLPLIQRKYIKLKSRLDVYQKWFDMGYPLNFSQNSQNLLNKLVVNKEREIYLDDFEPKKFSREELLTLGIYKVRKTFKKYHHLLSPETIEKTHQWHEAFTGEKIMGC